MIPALAACGRQDRWFSRLTPELFTDEAFQRIDPISESNVRHGDDTVS
jgi:hypothetical protein